MRSSFTFLVVVSAIHVVGKFNVKENPVLELVALAIHKRLTIAPFDFSSSGEK